MYIHIYASHILLECDSKFFLLGMIEIKNGNTVNVLEYTETILTILRHKSSTMNDLL